MAQLFSNVARSWRQAADLTGMVLGLTAMWVAIASYRRQSKRAQARPVQSNAQAERALRIALSSVARGEADQIEAAFAGLDESERTEALALAIRITQYIAVDACGSTWPTDVSIRRIANGLATLGTLAERLRLDADELYEYLSRVVFGSKRLEDVIAAEPRTRLPVMVVQRALAVYCPKALGFWEYLDQVESAIEAALALDETVLPAAVGRAYTPRSETFFQFPQDVPASDDAPNGGCATLPERSSEA
jgi:hypothetical protein